MTTMFGRLAVLATVVLAVVAPTRSAQAELADSPWPMFGHDLRHTGRGTTNGPSTGSVRIRWSYFAPANFKEAPPTIGPDGTIYIAVGLVPYCAVNPDGTQKWCTSGLGGGASDSAPTVGVDPISPLTGSVLYVGGRDNKTWAIKDNGQNSYTVLWRNKILADGDVHSSPLIDPVTNAVYSACGCVSAGQLLALNPTPANMADGLGEALWPAAIVSPSIHYISPAQDDRGDEFTNPRYRRVYVGSSDGKLHAYTADDTNVQWKKEWSFLPYAKAIDNQSSPIIGDDGTIYMGSAIGVSATIDLGSSSANKWPFFLTGARVDATPALSQDGNTLYFGTSTNPVRFYALNTSNGTLKWKYPASSTDPVLAGPIDVLSAIGANGIVYMTAGKKVYAWRDDGTQPTLIWSLQLGGVVQGLSLGDGVLYVVANDHKLYAIEDQ